MPYMTTSEARSMAAKTPPVHHRDTLHSRSFDSLDTLVPRCPHHSYCYYCQDHSQYQCRHHQHQQLHQNTRISGAMNATATTTMDRKRSHGIGGAGNIRRPSEPFNHPRHDEEATSSRRRSSVWSNFTPTPGSSPEGKRASFMSFFKKRRASEASNAEEEAPARSRDVDPEGNSK